VSSASGDVDLACSRVPAELRVDASAAVDPVSVEVRTRDGRTIGRGARATSAGPPVWEVPILIRRPVEISLIGDGQRVAGIVYVAHWQGDRQVPSESFEIPADDSTRIELEILSAHESTIVAYAADFAPARIDLDELPGFPLAIERIEVPLTAGRRSIVTLTREDGTAVEGAQVRLQSGTERVLASELVQEFWGEATSRTALGLWETAITDRDGRAVFHGLPTESMPMHLSVDGMRIVTPASDMMSAPAGAADWELRAIVAAR
jgi:hypothetical protein